MRMPDAAATADTRTTAGVPRDEGTAEQSTTAKYGAFATHTFCACATEDASAAAEMDGNRSLPVLSVQKTNDDG